MNREELAKRIYDTAHITGTFTLRSGAVSNEYFDKYQFESIPDLLQEIAKQMAGLINFEYDIIAGLEMGGIPLATAISFITGKPVVFVRKEAKKYGTAKLAEGPSIEGKRVLVIEDVVTSGGQVVISAKDLRERGAIITKALCVIDRESGGAKALEDTSIQLQPLFTMSEIKRIVGE
jgi:orotate phosphoribosyltransferase